MVTPLRLKKVSELEVIGASTFDGTTAFNGAVSFNTSVTYTTSTVYGASVTYNATAAFNGAATFNSTSTFNGAATFNSTSTFNGIASFNTAPALANNVYLTGVDYVGTGKVNIIKVNASDELEVGAALNLGAAIDLIADGGVIRVINQNVTSAASATVAQGYTFAIDNNDILQIYAESDGAGGIQNLKAIANVSLGVGGANTSTMVFQAISTTKAAIPHPVMTTAQRVVLSATAGSFVFDSDLLALYYGDGSNWVQQ